MNRLCQIVTGFVEDQNGGADGAYDLFNTVGSPFKIAEAIAQSLSTFWVGPELNAGQDVYLMVKIKVCCPDRIPDFNLQKWQKQFDHNQPHSMMGGSQDQEQTSAYSVYHALGEGPFLSRMEAIDFVNAEVGAKGAIVVKLADEKWVVACPETTENTEENP